MARTRQEVHSEDTPVRQPGDITLPGVDQVYVPEAESIALIEKPDTKANEEAYFKDLQFNEDRLTIVLEPGSGENAPLHQDVYVNGVCRLIPVGQEVVIPRKYVEVLIRSMPVTVRTEVEQKPGDNPVNHIRRTARAGFPLSILHDPAGGRGTEWLRRLRAQG